MRPERVATEKHSSLFVRSVGAEEGEFYKILTPGGQCYKTFNDRKVTTFHNKLVRYGFPA